MPSGKPASSRSYRYLFLFLFLITAYLAFRVVSPLLDSIIMGAIMAYLFYPVYRWLDHRLKRPAASAFLVCLIIALVSVVSVAFVGRAVANEARALYVSSKEAFTAGKDAQDCVGQTDPYCQVMLQIQSLVKDPQVRSILEDGIRAVGKGVFSRMTQFLYALPEFIIFVAVSFFISFFLFIDGRTLLTRIQRSLPISPGCQRIILDRVSKLTKAVVFGSVLVAMIQGAVALAGYLLLGLPHPFLWSSLTAVFALVPYVGTTLVWVPASLWFFAAGSPIKAVLLAVYGAMVISTIDNILKPLVIGRSGNAHPLLVFLGVVGGIAFMGPLGFIVGPVILALFEAMCQIYEVERRELS